MARNVRLQGSAVGKDACTACGKAWIAHNGIIGTCQELQFARQQLVDLRVTFFVLCLKYLPEGMEFTPDNLLTVMLRKKPNK